MESDEQQASSRGRARGRVRGPAPPPIGLQLPAPAAEGAEPGQAGAGPYQEMYAGERKSPGGSSGEGRGDGRGGRGSPGTAGARQVERGGLHSTIPAKDQYATDYVATRPDPSYVKMGTSGEQRRLITNYFSLKNHPKYKMHLYCVKVTPEVEEEKRIRALVRAKKEEIGRYMLTGYQLFTTLPLKEELLSYHTTLEGIETQYQVEFEFIREVKTPEPIVLQFYNALVRQIQRGLKYELMGRHYFDHTQKHEFINWKLELWPGFQNSIRQQEAGVMLNVESVWKVVKIESIFQVMTVIRNEEGPGQRFEQRCRDSIIGMVVVTKYNRKTYKIDEILFDKSPEDTFPRTRRLPGGESETAEVSFQDYFKERYNEDVRPRQPMLVSKPTKLDLRRGQVNDIILVPQLCFQCGLTDELRSNFRLMKDIATCLHMDPTKRVTTMRNFVDSINKNDQLRADLKSWGVAINREPVDLTGRALPPQEISVGEGQRIFPDDKADWTMGLRGVKMLTTVPLLKWAIIATGRDAANVGNLVSTMKRVGNPLGYQIREPEMVRVQDSRAPSYLRAIDQVVEQARGDLNMIFIVLGNNNLDTYGQVKKACSRQYGIPSQCFLSKNLTNKGLMSICTKMVIQMNAKQGGEPWGISNPMKTVMVLGYDVHHAGLGGGMSVGAMTATTNTTLGRYFSTIEKLPADRQEIAPVVGKMFDKCLRAYADKNGTLPTRVMMYRDGVGEGQLKDVHETEVTGLVEKMKNVYSEMEQELGKFTYIVVSKRINTRFFQERNQNYNNPMPGMVVDDIVTKPERYDFFLVSQIARQGCVSPTSYNVLYDTSNLKPDQMQVFTYKLCHLYFNWSGTVAVPGPCQNAHKYALQAGTAVKAPAHRSLDHLLHFL